MWKFNLTIVLILDFVYNFLNRYKCWQKYSENIGQRFVVY